MNFEIQKAIENLEMKEGPLNKTNIKVIGVGGAGSNIVSWLYTKGVKGAEIIAVNTDKKHLDFSKADGKLLIGIDSTKGFGCGGIPDKGKKAAEGSLENIQQLLNDVDLVFIACGLGGGTGTGAAPVIAKIAKEQNTIVFGIATMPFKIEKARIERAKLGLMELRNHADTVIVLDNNRLTKIAGDLPLQQAFAIINELISTMVKGIVETITVPSLVNLDFADLRSFVTNGGVCSIGVGDSSSDNKIEEAVIRALKNPFLDVDYNDASSALLHVEAGTDLTLDELQEVTKVVAKNLKNNSNIIWGSRISPEMDGKLKIMALINGVSSPHILGEDKKLELNSQKNLDINHLLSIL